MLSVQNRNIASHVLKNMVDMRNDGSFTEAQFDGEMKSYLQSLFAIGMEVEEMKELTRSVGLELDIRIHT